MRHATEIVSVTPHEVGHDKERKRDYSSVGGRADKHVCTSTRQTTGEGCTGHSQMRRGLTRLSASSHACFISVALALFALTSSLSASALAVASSSFSVLVLALELELGSVVSASAPS